MKVLLDEMLSPVLVDQLASIGVAAEAVAHVGMQGRSDQEVWRHAFDHDQVVVTANAKDFLNVAGNSKVHAGLIVLRVSGLTRDAQWALLQPVIEEVRDQDLLNKLVEVQADGRYAIRPLPP